MLFEAGQPLDASLILEPPQGSFFGSTDCEEDAAFPNPLRLGSVDVRGHAEGSSSLLLPHLLFIGFYSSSLVSSGRSCEGSFIEVFDEARSELPSASNLLLPEPPLPRPYAGLIGTEGASKLLISSSDWDGWLPHTKPTWLDGSTGSLLPELAFQLSSLPSGY